MRRVDSRVGTTLEDRRQIVSMLFTVGAPGGCGLLEHAIVAQPGYMRTSARIIEGQERTVSADAI